MGENETDNDELLREIANMWQENLDKKNSRDTDDGIDLRKRAAEGLKRKGEGTSTSISQIFISLRTNSSLHCLVIEI